MATTQINLRLDDELLAKVDAACGDVPRNRWITRAIEQRLEHNIAWGVDTYAKTHQSWRKADMSQPRSSQQAKADVQPRQKGK